MKRIKMTFWIIGFGCGMMVTAMIGVLLSLNLSTTKIEEPIVKAIVSESNDKQNKPNNIKKDETIVNIESQENKALTEVQKEAEEEKKIETTDKPKSCEITILDHYSGNDICQLLEEKGLVDNAESFRQYIWSQNKEKSLYSGTINIPYGLSYAELLSWLTT